MQQQQQQDFIVCTLNMLSEIGKKKYLANMFFNWIGFGMCFLSTFFSLSVSVSFFTNMLQFSAIFRLVYIALTSFWPNDYTNLHTETERLAS